MVDSCGSSFTSVINFFIKSLDVICYVEAISFHYDGSHDHILHGASGFLKEVGSRLMNMKKCNREGRGGESDAEFV